MTLDYTAFVLERQARVREKMERACALIAFTAQFAKDHEQQIHAQLTISRQQPFNELTAYTFAEQALAELDRVVNPPGIPSGFEQYPRAPHWSSVRRLDLTDYFARPDTNRFYETLTGSGTIVHATYCAVLDIPLTGRGLPLARLVPPPSG